MPRCSYFQVKHRAPRLYGASCGSQLLALLTHSLHPGKATSHFSRLPRVFSPLRQEPSESTVVARNAMLPTSLCFKVRKGTGRGSNFYVFAASPVTSFNFGDCISSCGILSKSIFSERAGETQIMCSSELTGVLMMATGTDGCLEDAAPDAAEQRPETTQQQIKVNSSSQMEDLAHDLSTERSPDGERSFSGHAGASETEMTGLRHGGYGVPHHLVHAETGRPFPVDVVQAIERLSAGDDIQKALSPFAGKLSARDATIVLKVLKKEQYAHPFHRWVTKDPSFRPSQSCYEALLRRLVHMHDFAAAELVVEEMTSSHILPSPKLCCSIMEGASAAGRFDVVEQWYHKMKAMATEMNLCSYNVMVTACREAGQYEKAALVFKDLKSTGLVLDLATYCNMLAVYSARGKAEDACQLFDELKKEGLLPDGVTYSILVDVHGKSGDPARAALVFQEMQAAGFAPDEVAYNTLIDAYAKAKMIDQALLLFRDAHRSGRLKGKVVYRTTIRMCGDAGLFDEAWAVLRSMQDSGVRTDEYPYHTLINAYIRSQNWEGAIRVYNDMNRVGCTVGHYTCNSMLTVYGKSGMHSAAEDLIKEMFARGIYRNVVAYSIMLSMYAKAGRVKDAAHLYRRMQQAGCQGNQVTYNTMMDMWTKLGNTKQARRLFCGMKEAGIAPDILTYTCLIKGHQLTGEFEEAVRLFGELKETGCNLDSLVYGSMIEVYGQTRQYDELQKLLTEMHTAGIKADFKMYKGMFEAYHNSRDPDNATTVLNKIWELSKYLRQKKEHMSAVSSVKQGGGQVASATVS